MAKFIGSTFHSVLIYIPHFLAFCAFGLLLGGVSAMQQKCGQAGADTVLGPSSYLAPIPCDRFFSFDWWILFFHFGVWCALLFFIFGRTIHKARNALTGLLISVSILLIFMTNTWYRPWSGYYIPLEESFKKRAKVTFAGALVGAVSDILLLITIGLHDESATPEERRGVEPRRGELNHASILEICSFLLVQPGSTGVCTE